MFLSLVAFKISLLAFPIEPLLVLLFMDSTASSITLWRWYLSPRLPSGHCLVLLRLAFGKNWGHRLVNVVAFTSITTKVRSALTLLVGFFALLFVIITSVVTLFVTVLTKDLITVRFLFSCSYCLKKNLYTPFPQQHRLRTSSHSENYTPAAIVM